MNYRSRILLSISLLALVLPSTAPAKEIRELPEGWVGREVARIQALVDPSHRTDRDYTVRLIEGRRLLRQLQQELKSHHLPTPAESAFALVPPIQKAPPSGMACLQAQVDDGELQLLIHHEFHDAVQAADAREASRRVPTDHASSHVVELTCFADAGVERTLEP